MEVGKDTLNTKGGMKALTDRLDRLFIANKGVRQFNAYYNLSDYRKKEGTSIQDFIGEFEHMCYKLTSEDVVLPDIVQAFCLLACCNLNENDRNLIMTGLPAEITYKDMSATRKHFI